MDELDNRPRGKLAGYRSNEDMAGGPARYSAGGITKVLTISRHTPHLSDSNNMVDI